LRAGGVGMERTDPEPIAWCITVDVEEEWPWEQGFPRGVPASLRNIEVLPEFVDTCLAGGAAVTLLANYAVMADPRAAAILVQQSLKPRVEVGMHLHPWNTPPEPDSIVWEDRLSYLSAWPADCQIAKLAATWEQFQRHGLTPRSFRGGRYARGPAITRWLQEHDFRVDSSIVPGVSWPYEGAPNYVLERRTPRRSLPTVTGRTAQLWEVPLSFVISRGPEQFWARLHQWEHHPLGLGIVALLNRIGFVRRIWLNLEQVHGADWRRLLQRMEAENTPCALFTLHSSSLLVGSGSPYSRTKADVERTWARLREVLLALQLHPRYVPATLESIALTLESLEDARDRNQPAG